MTDPQVTQTAGEPAPSPLKSLEAAAVAAGVALAKKITRAQLERLERVHGLKAP